MHISNNLSGLILCSSLFGLLTSAPVFFSLSALAISIVIHSALTAHEQHRREGAKIFAEEKIAKIFFTTLLVVQNIKKDLASASKRIVRLRQTLSAEQMAEKLNLPIDWVEKKLLEL